jgi:cob(I)alamin adenosyltransferase
MRAIGDVDEANSAIGVASGRVESVVHCAMLDRIQNELFDLGADMTSAPISPPPARISRPAR